MEKIFGAGHKRWLRVHHIIDWVAVVVMFVFSGLLSVFVEPFNRFLPESDPLINYPVKPNIVPLWMLLSISLVLPILAFAVTQIWHHSKHDFHHATLGVCSSFALTNLITTAIKLATGRYRPDYSPSNATNDSRMSFPSGHSSLAFSSMIFLSLYIAGKLQVYRVHSGSLVMKSLLIVSPCLISTFVAISRVMDYHHDFSDIIAGTILGCIIGFMNYFLWYPSLFSKRPDLARQHPIKSSDMQEELPFVNHSLNDNQNNEFHLNYTKAI